MTRVGLVALLSVACAPPEVPVESSASKAQRDVPPPRPRTIAYDAWLACAVERERLYCWGEPAREPSPPPWRPARLSSLDPPYEPLEVRLYGTPVEVALGGFVACVRVDSGDVLCSAPAFEVTETCSSASPTLLAQVALPGPADRIAARGGAGCARLTDGRVACWGRIESWSRRDPPDGLDGCTPRVVHDEAGEPLRAIERLEVGAAIDKRGRVAHWDMAAPALVASTVPGVASAVDLAVAGGAVVAVMRDGRLRSVVGRVAMQRDDVRAVRCGSHPDCGVLTSDGTVYEYRWAGLAPPSLRFRGPVEELEVGHGGGCLRSDGSLVCWGAARPGAPLDAPHVGPGRVELP